MKAPWPYSAPKGDSTDVENLPTPEGEALGREIARITALELAKVKAQFPDAPDPCHDCAFRPGTTPNKSPATLMDALKAVIECDPFYCHLGVEEGETPKRPCAGWAAAVSCNPELRKKLSEVRR